MQVLSVQSDVFHLDVRNQPTDLAIGFAFKYCPEDQVVAMSGSEFDPVAVVASVRFLARPQMLRHFLGEQPVSGILQSGSVEIAESELQRSGQEPWTKFLNDPQTSNIDKITVNLRGRSRSIGKPLL